jgi:signal transduction histidine kinase
MRLLDKSIFYFLLVSIPLLIIAGFLSFRLITQTVNENINENLWNGKLQAQNIIDSFDEPREMYLDYDSLSRIGIDKSGGSGYKITEIYRMDTVEHEQVKYRMLKGFYKRKGTNYLITIVKPMLEEDDLLENLFVCFLIIVGFVLLAFLTVSWFLSKWIWKPFYNIIAQLEKYEIRNNSFPSSSTKEFRQLGQALDKMSARIYKDFISQKEFAENASHEMQTPLAIIKAKLDTLMQSEKLGREEMEQLQGVENAVNRLSSLNKSLILLARIENSQFENSEEIKVSDIAERSLENFSEMLEARNLSLEKNMTISPIIKMNASLCEILINNLLQNAVRHNVNGGKIVIETGDKFLRIGNTGGALSISEQEMFERFRKNDASKESLGLGLAIVKSICEKYGFNISYQFKENLHIFNIVFLRTELL